ncbi:MAG: hypothetical protein FWH01_12915 [Oscillospiraceae bacterium]|nr:hypothetical protein [Oscillospiraceae bacterium]
MGYFTYVEIFRQISPPARQLVFDKMDFFVFGEFDGMFVHSEELESIASLKLFYEKRHEGLYDDTSCFLTIDRQPLFLYSSDKIPNDSNSIFSKVKAFPIVITLFQLDKKKYTKQELDEFISCCCDSIQTYIKSLPTCEGCANASCCNNHLDCSNLSFQVFYNLGEADLAVVFRAKYLQCIARLLENIRSIASLVGIPVLSISSYYGFPKSSSWQNNIKTWIEDESKITNTENASFQLNMLYDVPAKDTLYFDPKKIKPEISFVFGEWDYFELWNDPSVASYAADMIINNINLHWGKIINKKLRSSFTMATFQWPGLQDDLGTQNNYSSNNNYILEIQNEIMQIHKNLRDNFNTLIHNIKKYKDKYGSGYIASSTGTLESLGRTIYGLLGFLARLYIGRYEQDLYQYISPIFICLVKVIESYFTLINKSESKDNGKDTTKLIDECVRDTGVLITRLQQVYTVLGVSPHTFMETYGSSMRSLAASSKLMCAYQGMLHYIIKKFKTHNINSHVVLITPFRMEQPTNQILYALSSPENRICNIQVDYTRLFKKNAVFMLLHECAHHATDRLMEKRFLYFAKAWSMLIFTEIFGYWLDEPIESLIRMATENEDNDKENENHNRYVPTPKMLFYGLENNMMDYYKNELFKVIYEFIVKASEKNAADMHDKYKIIHRDNIQLFYLRHINEFVPDALKTIFFTENKINDYSNDIRNKLVDKVSELQRCISENNGNVREAIRLELVYKDSDTNKKLIDRYSGVKDEIIDGSKHYELIRETVNDVYSDLFAILVLDDNMGADTYIGALIEFFDTYDNDFFEQNEYFLLRLIIIAETMGWSGNKKIDEFIEKFINIRHIPANVADRLRGDWYRLKRLKYIDPILDYSNECKIHLENRISELQDEPVFINIRLLWQNLDSTNDRSIDNVAQSIYALWRYLMDINHNM